MFGSGGSLVQTNSSLGISLREDAPLPAQDWGQCSTTVIVGGGLSQEAVGWGGLSQEAVGWPGT